MTIQRSPRRLPPLLAALLTLIFAAPAGAQENGTSETALLNPLSSIDPAKLDGFLGRPLFSPTRRPPPAAASTPPAPPETAAEPSSPPALRLVGILRTPNESVAQVVGADGTQRLSLRVGDFLEDWTVASIEGSTLTLKQGEREASLTIFRGGAAETPAEPAAQGDAITPPAGQPKRKRTWSDQDRQGFFGE